jgi:hypothetical protein
MDLRTVDIADVRELLLRHVWKPTLWGDLAGMPMADLLNIFHWSRRSGLLVVRTGDEQRVLGFREGEVVMARSTLGNETSARDVCFALLLQEAGSFVFLRGPLYAFRSIEACDVQEILLDGLRRVDEASWPPAVSEAA